MMALLRLAETDPVAIATRDIAAGEQVTLGAVTVTVAADVPLGYKVALRAIAAGEPVHKYRVPIGSATADIRPGDRITHRDGKEIERDALDIILRGIAANPDDAGGKNVTFTIRRDKATRKVALTAGYFKAEVVLGVKREADESWGNNLARRCAPFRPLGRPFYPYIPCM